MMSNPNSATFSDGNVGNLSLRGVVKAMFFAGYLMQMALKKRKKVGFLVKEKSKVGTVWLPMDDRMVAIFFRN